MSNTMDGRTDESLVLSCVQGDPQFFGALYERYFDKIYRFIYFRLGHKQIAEDLASEVFNKVLQKLGSFNPKKAKFSTWLFQIARNGLIDYYRTNKKSEDIENFLDLASPENLEKHQDIAIELQKLNALLQNLTSQHRSILMMRLWDGMAYKEIAELLNLNEANCKVIFSRTLQKIQKEIGLAILILFLTPLEVINFYRGL